MLRKWRWFLIRPIFRLFEYQTETLMSAITELKSAIADNTQATNAAVEALGQIGGLAAATATVADNTKRLNDAVAGVGAPPVVTEVVS